MTEEEMEEMLDACSEQEYNWGWIDAENGKLHPPKDEYLPFYQMGVTDYKESIR